MVIHSTADTAKTDLVVDLGNYEDVWYHPNGIANILTFVTINGNSCSIWKKDGSKKI